MNSAASGGSEMYYDNIKVYQEQEMTDSFDLVASRSRRPARGSQQAAASLAARGKPPTTGGSCAAAVRAGPG